MEKCYSIEGTDTNTDDTTILSLVSAVSLRPHVYEIIWGSDAAPVDQSVDMHVERFTAAGTGTAVTPNPLDTDHAAAVATAAEAHTGEPTYGGAPTVLLRIPFQQKNGYFRWCAEKGREITLPATAGNGIGIKGRNPTVAFAMSCTILFFE